MRRSDREITDRAEIDEIVHHSTVCRIAFAVANEPYVVPLSFGYDGRSLYVHTAQAGKKIDCIAANSRVCFEFERNVRILPHTERACGWTISYESVIGFGTVEELRSSEEKKHGLDQIMKHYSLRRWEFDSDILKNTRVWKITIQSLSGKRSGIKRT